MSVTLSKFIKCFLDSQNMHEALKFKQAIKKIAWHFIRSADFGIFGGRGRERERIRKKNSSKKTSYKPNMGEKVCGNSRKSKTTCGCYIVLGGGSFSDMAINWNHGLYWFENNFAIPLLPHMFQMDRLIIITRSRCG